MAPRSSRSIAWSKPDPFGAEFVEVRLGRDELAASGVALGGAPLAYRLDCTFETVSAFVTSQQHWQAMIWGAEIELYVGDGARARARAYQHLEQRQRKLNASFLLHAGFVRAATLYMRGRAAIASIGSRGELRRSRIAEARRMSRQLAHEHDPWTAALALLLRGMADNAAGNRAAAITALRTGIDRAEATDTLLYAHAARYRLGELVGGDVGSALIREAVEAMSAEGVRNPQRWGACHMPGAWQSR